MENTMRKITTLFLVFLLSFSTARADEGMWLLNLLQKMRMSEMQDMGLELSQEDIYSVNNSSMKDGLIMLSGGSCTAEMVSEKGLALTNHHCAYDAIRSHSDTGSKNYLEHGFWAEDHQKELPVEGMTASILLRIEDVNDRFEEALSDTMDQMTRESKKRKLIQEIEGNAFEEGQPYEAQVKEFYSGDKFYLFVYKVFEDVRLVGAPPSDIGKFGGDEDNWEWPRQTGDFSLIRVYANEDNEPAPYSEDNVPYEPDHHFPVSLEGVDEGDFTFIMGFPGRTQRYLSSFGIQQALDLEYPARINLREKRLELMRENMDASEKVDIAYASKYAQVSNYYKYFKGQTQRLNDLGVKKEKEELEAEFRNWAQAEPQRKEKYGGTIDAIEKSYEDEREIVKPMVYLQEAAFASELVRFGMNFQSFNQAIESGDEEAIEEQASELRESAKEHFRNYHAPTDRKVTNELYRMYYEDVAEEMVPDVLVEHYEEGPGRDKLFGGNKGFGTTMFENSFLDDEEKVMEFLEDPEEGKLDDDMGFQTAQAVMNTFRGNVGRKARMVQMQRKASKRRFILGLKKMNPDKEYYPNANSTPRLTYGTVSGYDHPTDGLLYDHKTTLEGMIDKDDPDKRLFDVPEELEALYEKKDYGRYADPETGELPLCFVHNTDITGGNSGSPVFNGKGHLVGCAFDGNWEAMSGDIAYEPDLQRTISVDARYILFVIDKFAEADHLVKEMDVVGGKDGS